MQTELIKITAGLALVALGSCSGGGPEDTAETAGDQSLAEHLKVNWGIAVDGANVYFTVGPAPDRIDFVREDVHGGVTTVVRRGEVTTMYTNGKFQGDDGPEMPAQPS